MSTSCEQCVAPKLIFSCSGAADVGELADRVARKLSRDGIGKMYCLSGLGANIENFVNHTKTASKILVLDGCPVDCARKVVEKSELKDVEYLRITDFGFIKGKTIISESLIDTVVMLSSNLLKDPTHV